MTHPTHGWSWREFWLGLDRWVNTWFGGASLETISARAGRAEHKHWWAAALCWGLSWFDRGHCRKAAHGAGPHETKPPIDLATRRRLEALAKRATQERSGRRPPERS